MQCVYIYRISSFDEEAAYFFKQNWIDVDIHTWCSILRAVALFKYSIWEASRYQTQGEHPNKFAIVPEEGTLQERLRLFLDGRFFMILLNHLLGPSIYIAWFASFNGLVAPSKQSATQPHSTHADFQIDSDQLGINSFRAFFHSFHILSNQTSDLPYVSSPAPSGPKLAAKFRAVHPHLS